MSESKRDGRGGPRIVGIFIERAGRRCLLCGALVAHVDDHYEWHVKTDRILADSLAHVLDSEDEQ